MTTNIVTQDNMNTYNAEMAKIMGVADDDDSSETKTSTLARVKIIHAPIMGMKTIDGEETETVVVKGGSYSIQMPDDKVVYGSKLTMRPFMQRYMYKKYVQGTDVDNPGYFVKTIMADSLNQDLIFVRIKAPLSNLFTINPPSYCISIFIYLSILNICTLMIF